MDNEQRVFCNCVRNCSTLPNLAPAVFLVCHRGNDSQLAVRHLSALCADRPRAFRDLRGGLQAWADEVDPKFPRY